MATSFYFNNFASSQEQLLIENLIVESIKIYGYDLYYLPRTLENKDNVYGEDPSSSYNDAYMLEMYIKNVEGFEGEGDFLSKFNLEIRDRVTFTVARKVFNEEVGFYEEAVRPKEGDLIYFPLNKKFFQVKFVEHEAIFYQLGSLQTYDLICELFEYGGESINTGIAEIDQIQSNYSPAMNAFSVLTEDDLPFELKDEDGYKLVNEEYALETVDPISDNQEIQIESDTFIDFSEIDPFSEGNV